MAPGVVRAQVAAQSEATLPEVKVQGSSTRDEYAPAVATIGGKSPTAIRDIPQSVVIVNRAVMDAQGASSLTQALRNVPGITISAGEGGNIGDNINLRGFSSRTDLFIDGMRDRGQYTRDTFFLESVEVLKGPSSMLFGRGSTGGVINQVAKRPNLTPSNSVGITVGTQDYRRLTVDLNRPVSDTGAFRIAAFAHDADSTRDVIEARRIGVAPSLRLGIGTATEITLTGLLQQGREIPDYGFPLVPVSAAGVGTLRKPVNAPRNAYYGYLDDRFDQDIAVFGATLAHKLNASVTIRNQLQYSRYTLDASPSPLSAPTVIGGGIATLNTPLNLLQSPRQDRDRKIKDSSLYNQTDVIWKTKFGETVHTITAGVEIGTDDYDFTRHGWTPTNVNINLGNPVNGNRTGARTLQTKTDTSATSLATYVNDEIQLNRQWKAVAGLRWDRFDASTTQIDYSLISGAVTKVATRSHLDIDWSTRGGIIYQPNDASSYYVSYGTSLNPGAEAVSQSTTANAASLDAEKSRSYETGAKWDLMGGNLSLNAALFRVEKTNAKTTDPVTGLQSLSGNIRVDGFEAGVTGRLNAKWQLIAGYSHLNGQIVKSHDVGTGADLGIRADGKILPNTPKHTASVWTAYQFLPGWEAGAGVVHSSARYLNNFETAQTDAFTRVDATLAYRQKEYDVRLNLLNISNEPYFESASGGRATPVEGRKASVTFTYRF